MSIIDAARNTTAAGIIYTGTTQVNILVPATVGLGPATLTLSNSLGTAKFLATVGNIAPGLFTVDSAVTIPAAQVITTAADGSQIVAPVANCSSACTLTPIVLNPAVPLLPDSVRHWNSRRG